MLTLAKRLVKRAMEMAFSEEELLQRLFIKLLGRRGNFRHPADFSEKVQWRKLYDRNSGYIEMSDKVLVKDVIRHEFGEDWLIPTLWAGEHLTDAILADLPVPLVVKSNHSSGDIAYVIAPEDAIGVAAKANGWLAVRLERHRVEWAYYGIRPQIIIEPFIGDPTGTPPADLKFFVFAGKVEYIQVDTDRRTGHKRTFYTPAWERCAFELEYPADPNNYARPAHLAKMISFAEQVGKKFAPDFVRVDLYEVGDAVLFGEATFYPGSGFDNFRPVKMDRTFGDLWPSLA